jgi:hypothetical protein
MAADCTRSSDFADHDPSRIVTNIAPFLRIAHQISAAAVPAAALSA